MRSEKGEGRSKDGNLIKTKSTEFAIRIINLCNYLKQNKKEYSLAEQLLRSGTSIGANYRESQNASSKKDFLNKISIALKEANETEYWLELLLKTNYITEAEYKSIYKDCDELVRLLTSSVKSAKDKRNGSEERSGDDF